MLLAKDMTTFQKITTGLKIFEEYLSPRDNPGDISAEHDVIYVGGVHRDMLGDGDLARVAALGWTWNSSFDAWEYSL